MPNSLQFNSITPRPVPDCIRFSLIKEELNAMLQRQEKLPIDVGDHYFINLLENILEQIEEYENYEPSDEEILGEPPISAHERWTAAHAEHIKLHS